MEVTAAWEYVQNKTDTDTGISHICLRFILLFFTTTDSSHKGNEIPVGNKLVFEDSGVVSQPDFLG